MTLVGPPKPHRLRRRGDRVRHFALPEHIISPARWADLTKETRQHLVSGPAPEMLQRDLKELREEFRKQSDAALYEAASSLGAE